ncbi:MAG: hypothetical protein ACHQ4H_05335 [Ktedonobacterales bacterium]
MARTQREDAQVAALLAGLDGSQDRLFRETCAAWVAASPRFRAFLAAYAAKVTKKLHHADGVEGRHDVLLELCAAHRLLLDHRFALDYERYAAAKTRGPDFTVTFKTRTTFNLEVKRLRTSVELGRWANMLCDKLGQMPPSIINVLLIGCDEGAAAAPDVEAAMARLQALAERKDDEFFGHRGLLSPREYLRQLGRLSAIVLIPAWDRATADPLSLWSNPQANHPLPRDLLRALGAL